MSDTKQPIWKYAGRLGDCDPIAYGGGFVYTDETGVYPPELTYFEPGSDAEWEKAGGETTLTIYRLVLDPPRFKTLTELGKHSFTGYINSARDLKMSDRGKMWEWHNEWYVDKLGEVAQTCGSSKFELLRELFSKDAITRAHAYESLILYFGPFEFDQYPLTMTEDEAYARYGEEMKLARAS